MGLDTDGVRSVFLLIETTSNVGAFVAGGCASTVVVATDIHNAVRIEMRT